MVMCGLFSRYSLHFATFVLLYIHNVDGFAQNFVDLFIYTRLRRSSDGTRRKAHLFACHCLPCGTHVKEVLFMKLGVVGLPNVGKSTLFNAITQAGAEIANYPFCTIEPNVGGSGGARRKVGQACRTVRQ